jgi:hypothetical protein
MLRNSGDKALIIREVTQQIEDFRAGFGRRSAWLVGVLAITPGPSDRAQYYGVGLF